MAKRPKKNQKEIKGEELVVAAFAETLEQVKTYEVLLKNEGIPALIKKQNEDTDNSTQIFTIMVPENFLDEAHVVIESQNAYDDFYDFAFEAEDNEDFDSDLFDDEF